MIAIEVYTQPDGELLGFCSKGHSGYSGAGYDIVCAAVSSALYMAVNTITDVIKVTPELLYLDDGLMNFRIFTKDTAACRELLMGLKLHLLGLEEEYTDYLKVSYMEV